MPLHVSFHKKKKWKLYARFANVVRFMNRISNILSFMARNLFSIVIMIACAFFLGSCDSDDLSVEECKLDMNLFDQRYTVDDEGCCVLKGTKPVPGDEVQSKVVGYGWKSIATYEVQANGKLSQVDYYEDLIGAAPTHYWFASSRQLVKYYYVDVYPSAGFFRESWSYDATKGFILTGDEMLSIKERYLQVLKLDESNGKTLMYTMTKLGVRGNGKGDYEPIYGMVVYRQMTDDELKKAQETYTHDFSEKGTTSTK